MAAHGSAADPTDDPNFDEGCSYDPAHDQAQVTVAISVGVDGYDDGANYDPFFDLSLLRWQVNKRAEVRTVGAGVSASRDAISERPQQLADAGAWVAAERLRLADFKLQDAMRRSSGY